MIKNKELNPGNFIHFDNVRSQVTEIQFDIPGVTHKILFEGYYRYINVESERALGIKISSDVLVEFGFKRKFNFYKRVEKWSSIDAKFVFYFDRRLAVSDSSLITKSCRYLHQLQNEYHEFTGLELSSRITENPKGNMLSIFKHLLMYGNSGQKGNVWVLGIFNEGVSLVNRQLSAARLHLRNIFQLRRTNGEISRPERETS